MGGEDAPARPWQPFPRGDGKGQYITGVLDTHTEDRSVIWVYMSSGAGRRLIHSDDGFRLMEPGQ